MRIPVSLVLAVCFTLGLSAAQNTEPAAAFIPHPIATNIYGGEQLLTADVNHDGKMDVIALGAQMSQLVWFENPYWQRHTIMHGTIGMTNLAAEDVDGDGVPELALVYGFRPGSQGAGTIALLQHLGDPRGIWTLRNIHSIEPQRRLLWADVEGAGERVLVDAPAHDSPTDFLDGSDSLSTNLVFYRPGGWQQEMVTLNSREEARDLLVSDSGRIAMGAIQGKRFFAVAADNRLSIYRLDSGGQWQATAVDSNLPNGRALLAVDANKDGIHEIVASSAQSPRRVYLYRATDSTGSRWTRSLLDESMAAAYCAAADINADNKVDISCVDDASPFSVHWYQNVSD